MNYYLDTEFIEDFTPKVFNLNNLRWQHPKHYIDLISIGIVSEDNREYYAINKEFDLKHVWNKYDLQLPEQPGDEPIRVYWLRENVLKPIWEDLSKNITGFAKDRTRVHESFTYKNLKQLIQWYGKTREQIAAEIKVFTAGYQLREVQLLAPAQTTLEVSRRLKEQPPTFYGYYCDYDWVVFCSLFGRMIDLPKGYPMFCMDLKQDMEMLGFSKTWKDEFVPGDNEHHALADARWNKKLHDTIKNYAKAMCYCRQSTQKLS